MGSSVSRGIVFNIQRFCIHDGPGIRTTVFFKGCPLRCVWCANPESQQTKREILFYRQKCQGCGECVSHCPQNAVVLLSGKAVIDRDSCNGCGQCQDVCTSNALVLTGKRMTPEEVVAIVAKDYPYYRRSGGGVTISGGEPLSQPQFLEAILKMCKKAGISTAIETTCNQSWSIIARVLDYLDLVILDLKHIDSDKHKNLTGVPNERIKENAKKLAQSGNKMLIRLPIIPGINDSDDEIIRMAKFINGLENISEVQTIAYHPFGIGKYDALGLQYRLGDIQIPSPARINEILTLLKQYIIPKNGQKIDIKG